MKLLFKSFLIACIFSLQPISTQAQEDGYFDVGPNVFNFNVVTNSTKEFRILPQIDLLNGAFLRYNILKFSIRGQVYFNKYVSNKNPSLKFLGSQNPDAFDSSSYVGYRAGGGIAYNLEYDDCYFYPALDIFFCSRSQSRQAELFPIG